MIVGSRVSFKQVKGCKNKDRIIDEGRVIDVINVDIPNYFRRKGRWLLVEVERYNYDVYVEIHEDHIIEIIS